MSNARVVELTHKLAEAAAAVRKAYAEMVASIAEIQDADIAHLAGYSKLSMLVADVARINPSLAARLIRHAEAIAEAITPTGHITPAPLPVLRVALLDGELDAGQVDAIVRTMTKIPRRTRTPPTRISGERRCPDRPGHHKNHRSTRSSPQHHRMGPERT